MNDLDTMFGDKRAIVGVIGLGHVGLPVCLLAARAGYHVIGFEIDEGKANLLRNGRSMLHHIPDASIADAIAKGNFEVEHDFRRLAEADAILICVPTPLNEQLDPDLSFIEQSGAIIAKTLKRGQLIVLESTASPGTTADVLRPALERSGLISGTDFLIAYSPSRVDPANQRFSLDEIPKVVGADTEQSLQAAVALYTSLYATVVPVSSSRVAEAVKITENVFRAVNVALANELKQVYQSMGIDIWEVISAAETKPFGFMPFYPGPGLGGHCIPIDPIYLTRKAIEFGTYPRLIELATELNLSMPERIVEKLIIALASQSSKELKGSRVLVVGVAYKRNVSDTRQSPSLRIIALIEAQGASVCYFDPLVPSIPVSAGDAASRVSEIWSETIARDFDAVLVLTDHDHINYRALVTEAKIVLDTRNVFRRAGILSDKIILA